MNNLSILADAGPKHQMRPLGGSNTHRTHTPPHNAARDNNPWLGNSKTTAGTGNRPPPLPRRRSWILTVRRRSSEQAHRTCVRVVLLPVAVCPAN